MSTLSNEILFKKFEVISCYKKDEHSAVYLANHIYLEKKVFLKILNTETIPDTAITERFKREAKILAQLEHPNIIKVLDFGMFKKYFYISFEYFESKNLREFLKETDPNDKVKRQIFVQIVKGLDFAHQKNIIHRDIKPDNILINENNEVKLTDFGLAQDSLDNFVTQRYSVIGTPAYMSPEQIQGEKLTIKSDLFSLGITTLEMFKNKNPFLGKDSNETINNIISFEENNYQEMFLELDEEIQRVLKGLLIANPENRIDSCSKILNILNEKNESLPKVTRNNKKKIWVFFIVAAILVSTGIIIYFILLSNKPVETVLNKSQKKSQELNIGILEDTAKTKTPWEQNELQKIKKTELEDITPNINNRKIKLDNSEISKNKSQVIKEGELYIKCYPWAKVYLDNKYIETTPLTKNITAKTGNYLLTLVHPNYPKFSDSIKISENKLAFVEVNLDTLFGYFYCQVYPWSEIYIDGIKKGVTPLSSPIKLEEGRYNLKLINPQFENIESIINIKRNDTLEMKFNMNKGLTN